MTEHLLRVPARILLRLRRALRASRAPFALCVALLAAWLPGSATFARAEDKSGEDTGLVVFYPHSGRVQPVDAAMLARAAAVPVHLTVETSTVTWRFAFEDIRLNNNQGFDHPDYGAAAVSCLGRVAEYLSSVLNHPGSVDMLVDESVNFPDRLAQAGSFYFTSSGFQTGLVQRHITSGLDPSAANPDGIAQFSFAVDWNFNPDVPTVSPAFDFFTTSLHELTHSLGYAALVNADGSSPFAPATTRSLLDKGFVTGSGFDLFRDDGVGIFEGTAAQLTGSDGGIFFTHPESDAVFGGRVPMHSPNPFNPGTSLSHPATSVLGAVMLPSLTRGSDRRQYLAVEIAQLRALGYDAVAPEAPPTAVKNVSTRGFVGSNDSVMIAGVIVQGPDPRDILITGVGPDLRNFGINDTVDNPILSLFQGQTVLETNDDWQLSPNSSAIAATGFAPNHPLEAAILRRLAPGAYTAILQGAMPADIGVGLVQAFDRTSGGGELRNLSTRLFVGLDDKVMIAGLIVEGQGTKRFVLRGLGPTLGDLGVAEPLADPNLLLLEGSTPILQNNDWTQLDAASRDVVTSAGLAPAHAEESVVVVDLDAGSYTAILSGIAGGTGNALIEIYSITTP